MATPIEEWVQWYIDSGYSPVPVPFREKGPIISEWRGLRIKRRNIPEYFAGEPTNVGLILGIEGGVTHTALARILPYLISRPSPKTDPKAWIHRTARPSVWLGSVESTLARFGPTTPTHFPSADRPVWLPSLDRVFRVQRRNPATRVPTGPDRPGATIPRAFAPFPPE